VKKGNKNKDALEQRKKGLSMEESGGMSCKSAQFLKKIVWHGGGGTCKQSGLDLTQANAAWSNSESEPVGTSKTVQFLCECQITPRIDNWSRENKQSHGTTPKRGGVDQRVPKNVLTGELEMKSSNP